MRSRLSNSRSTPMTVDRVTNARMNVDTDRAVTLEPVAWPPPASAPAGAPPGRSSRRRQRALPTPPVVAAATRWSSCCASTSARSSSSSAPAAGSARSSAMRTRDTRRPGRHQPPRPRALAVHRQARAGALAGRPSRRCGRSSARTRSSPRSASATCASASCCCRPSTARRSSATREVIAEATEREIDSWPLERALRAGAADAGDHPRRDHGRDLRDRGHGPRRGTPEHRLRTTIQAAWSTPRPSRWPRSPS